MKISGFIYVKRLANYPPPWANEWSLLARQTVFSAELAGLVASRACLSELQFPAETAKALGFLLHLAVIKEQRV